MSLAVIMWPVFCPSWAESECPECKTKWKSFRDPWLWRDYCGFKEGRYRDRYRNDGVNDDALIQRMTDMPLLLYREEDMIMP